MRAPLIAATALAMALCGCTYDLTNWERCDLDPEACERDLGEWATVAGCASQGPLQLAIGTGAVDYEPLAAGQAFKLNAAAGGGQGSDVRHVDVGLRVVNPDPVQRKFRIDVTVVEVLTKKTPPWLRDQKDCSSGTAPSDAITPPQTPTPAAAEACEVSARTRFVVERSWQPGPGGAIQRGGLRNFVSSQPKRVRVSVVDTCGRQGTAEHVVQSP